MWRRGDCRLCKESSGFRRLCRDISHLSETRLRTDSTDSVVPSTSTSTNAKFAMRIGRLAAAAARRPLHHHHLLATTPPRLLLRPPQLLSCRLLSSAPRSSSDPYATLGLPPDATIEQVKAAYYKLAMQTHPDRSEAPDAIERFNEVGDAYAKIMGTQLPSDGDDSQADDFTPKAAPFAAAYPPWVYRVFEYLQRVPQRFDLWLMPSYSSIIYQHVRANELGEALAVLDEMKAAGEQPSWAVYEMLIRGCAIAMRRPKIGGKPDHLTLNMVQRVVELWGDMEANGRKPDYLTHIELLRAFGKAGQLKQAHLIFEQMCGKVQLLPEERAFNSMYEACVMNGA